MGSRLRSAAQRPLPSVMIATYLGAAAEGTGSDLEDFRLFGLEEIVDLLGGGVGVLLELRLGAALVVLADLPLLLQLTQAVHDVPAGVADGRPPLLGDSVHPLHQLAATLLVQLGNLQADDIAVVGGREADVG